MCLSNLTLHTFSKSEISESFHCIEVFFAFFAQLTWFFPWLMDDKVKHACCSITSGKFPYPFLIWFSCKYIFAISGKSIRKLISGRSRCFQNTVTEAVLINWNYCVRIFCHQCQLQVTETLLIIQQYCRSQFVFQWRCKRFAHNFTRAF